MQRIVEIKALQNGAHENQSYHGFAPEGWAVIPDDMETPNFPFGEVEAEEIDGVMTVTKWIADEMPDAVEEEPLEAEPTADELIDILLGVTSDE